MQFATIATRAQVGIDAPSVLVEIHLSSGLPHTTIVGLPETAVRESKDRVRSALLNSHFEFPLSRITINLAPADLPKDGGGRYDLAIALGILGASQQVPGASLQGFEFIGELALNGEIRPVCGALPAARACHAAGRTLILPVDNAAEAARIPGASVIPARSLLQVCAHLNGSVLIDPQQPLPAAPRTPPADLSEVLGQARAKRALAVAAAGRLNLLMSGPPGTGKTMLATRMPGILPPLDDGEWLEVAAIHSIAGCEDVGSPFDLRPFRAPHRCASAVALVRGGGNPRPGEITLAHNGVLFLDELPEWPRRMLELLREPLESGTIAIARAARRVHFPARFQLLAAMNPCPCGYLGSGFRDCRCTPDQVQRYRDRLSGPLLDRFDLLVDVARPGDALFTPAAERREESSATIRERVIAAHARQLRRQGETNSTLGARELERVARLAPDDRSLLLAATQKWGLSARAYHRVLRVARSIADLEDTADIASAHLAEALGYRVREAAREATTHPCETKCRRNSTDAPIAIAWLKRFLGDNFSEEPGRPISRRYPEKIAIIGAGPAGLAAANDLALLGYSCTIFESNATPGGMLRMGVPTYRLPRASIDNDVNLIKKLGVEIRYNATFGADITFDSLEKDGFSVVFLGVGLLESRTLNIEGVQLDGVLKGVSFLNEVNTTGNARIGKHVLVIGGGAVAMDCARTALRLKPNKVSIACLESRKEMPTTDFEIEEAIYEASAGGLASK